MTIDACCHTGRCGYNSFGRLTEQRRRPIQLPAIDQRPVVHRGELPKPHWAIGQEGDEDVRFDAMLKLVVDRAELQVVLEVLERLAVLRLDLAQGAA